VARLRKFLIYIFIASWLLPIIPVGIFRYTMQEILPDGLTYPYSIGCLFTTGQKMYPRFYAEELTGSGKWKEIPHRDFFKIHPFGNRTRFARLLGTFKLDDRVLGSVARYTRDRYNQSAPSHRERISKIRFVRALFESTPERPFPWPSLNEIPLDEREVFFTEKSPRRAERLPRKRSGNRP